MTNPDDPRANFRRTMDALRQQGEAVISMTENGMSQLARMATRMTAEAQAARLGWNRQIDEMIEAFDRIVQAEKEKSHGR
jgi:flavin reductase (DIM6/NTAB) family NADH-FMN oxidoreductase RutF